MACGAVFEACCLRLSPDLLLEPYPELCSCWQMIEASEAHLWLNRLNPLPEMLCSLAVLPGTFLRRLRQGLTRTWPWSGLCAASL